MNQIIVISGADSNRYRADENHFRYCQAQGIPYQFYLRTDLSNPFYTKCYSILDCFDQGFDRVVWIDDDAFFIDNNWSVSSVFDTYDHDIVVTRGRDKKSGTTYFNNGIMFIRNTPNTRAVFERIPDVSLEEMRAAWQPAWGPMVGNDQPRMIYLTQTHCTDRVMVIDYPGFNAAEISFLGYVKHGIPFPPIVHVTGTNKVGKIKRFTETTGIALP